MAPPAVGGPRRRGGLAVQVPTWFLACLYRVCFKASESKVALSTSLTSNAASAALRRSSPFPKVGIGCKANRPPGGSSVHLHQRPRGPALARLPAATSPMPHGRFRACMHATASPRATCTRRQTHGHTDTGQMPHGCRKLRDREPRRGRVVHACCKQQEGHQVSGDKARWRGLGSLLWTAREGSGSPVPGPRGRGSGCVGGASLGALGELVVSPTPTASSRDGGVWLWLP